MRAVFVGFVVTRPYISHEVEVNDVYISNYDLRPLVYYHDSIWLLTSVTAGHVLQIIHMFLILGEL